MALNRIQTLTAQCQPAEDHAKSTVCRLTSILAAVWFVAVCPVPVASQDPRNVPLVYRIEHVPGGAAGFTARFTADQMRVLEALNRVDRAHLTSMKEVIVPEVWHVDLLAYSPFPSRIGPWGADQQKLLIVHQPAQAFAAYEDGRLIRWGPVSTGKATTPTPQGLFNLNWRSPGRVSTVDRGWFLPWYFNFQNERGLSFHQYALPGRPASHACVRLLERDARWLYEWGQGWTLDERGWEILTKGTPVLVVGCYAYSQERPWHAVAARGIELPAFPSTEVRSCSGGNS